MGYTIDIDTGGTFTDGFFTQDDRFELVKVDTTPHDLTVCFMECIKEGVRAFGLKDVNDFLKDTDVVRFSTTMGTNALLQKTGTKLGLIVTKGFESNLYQENGGNPFDFIIEKGMVIGIGEEISLEGEVLTPIDEKEVREAVKKLLEKGARMIVVSLRRSTVNPVHEQKIRELIIREYPKHYLGSVPLLLGSQISIKSEPGLRTNTALVNAYLHQGMVRTLYKADEDLRLATYTKPLLIVHSTGGVARVAKTTAVHTYNSGPLAGLYGSLEMVRLYDRTNVITVDVGGTSADVGLIHQGNFETEYPSKVEGIPIDFPVVKLTVLGAAGGSIARIEPSSKRLVVGPDSAGAMPGPVCYGLGGSDPTTTDSYLALGYFDPDYFMGGQKSLDKSMALDAIETDIASPLGITVEEAAFEIKEFVKKRIGDEIGRMIKEKGLGPQDFSLFAFGGGGGCLCCDIADQVGISRIHVFNQGPVFCAFGSSTMDVLHIYEDAHKITLRSGSGQFLNDFDEYNQVIVDLQEKAFRDMRGEGFRPEDINFELELEIKGKTNAVPVTVENATLFFQNKKDVQTVCNQYTDRVSGNSEIGIELFRLKAVAITPHYQYKAFSEAGYDPSNALKTKRDVYWGKKFVETNVYDFKLLESGNIVKGPALIEAEDTTYVIPKGRRYVVDQYLNGIIEED
ncbi:hydantoinase/oxoprolinase [delta proteobacterium NaphS2]|nr:hydantoinase/oxoprolinase [delta proteobacterium NaphS2]